MAGADLHAGALDRRVRFRRATLVDDGFGMVPSWADHGPRVAARRQDVSDAERWRAGEVAAHVTARFVIRWSAFAASITAADRLVCEGREYDIGGLKEVQGRRQFLEITASARAE
jgi:SPP1 family predicted phage head-tail adaptor